MWKSFFFHFTLVLTGGSFCSFTVCTWLRFLSEVGGAGSFSVSAKNWSDSLAACEVRHAWEPLDLLFQMFSWSPLPEIFLISSFQIVSWCHPCRYPLSFPTLSDILFNKSESDVRRIHLCQLLENSISPPAAPAQEINTSEVPPFPLYLEILSCLQPI